MVASTPVPFSAIAPDDRRSSIGLVETVGCGFLVVNLAALHLAKLGVLVNISLMGASLCALGYVIQRGFVIGRARSTLMVVVLIFAYYFLYSGLRGSFEGFRNAAAVLTAAGAFLFFFVAAERLRGSIWFIGCLAVGFVSLILAGDSPYAVGKNNINSAQCYFLIALFMCLPGIRRLDVPRVGLLMAVIFSLSILNNHRTLAGASVLLFMQFCLLRTGLYRQTMRPLMFIGLAVVSAVVIALLVNPIFALITSAADSVVTGEGGRTINSGREFLWPMIWGEIATNPLTGVGPGAVVADIYDTTLSAHNLYLQTALQLGLPGFALMLLLFRALWTAAAPPVRASINSLRASDFMTVIVTLVAVHSMFDVFLTQNAMSLGVTVWMVLGLGFGALAADDRRVVRA